MNKHLHRVVFNAARGQRMAVQETASSAGKGRARSTGSALAVTLAGLLGALPAQSQIVANPFAPPGQQPQVLVAPNGVPLVNIGTPSAAGVSINSYNRFDVQAAGAILNNSRTNVQTQLGGWVQGNPWLAGGPARIIVNQVSSSDPSLLRGYVEVAGQRAEVVIANPNGIQVDGAGFINASKVTLSTGVPQYNAFGGLDAFAVRDGTIRIDGAGLDLSRTDYAAILSRALQLNAAIYANDLKVVTGANQISADAAQVTALPAGSGAAAPGLALDVARLGGMYANKIVLVGTEAGLGMRNAGNIGAGAGGLVVTAAGRLENTGTLDGASVQLASAADIDNRGGTIRQSSAAPLTLAAPTLSNTEGGWIGTQPLSTSGGSGETGGTGTSPGTATPGGSTEPATPGGSTEPATGSGSTAAPAAPPQPGAINAAGAILNDGGEIYAGGPITLQSPNIINTGGTLSVANMALNQQSFSNHGGTLNVSGSFSANVQSFDNSTGTLRAGSLNIATTGDLINTDGTLTSDSDATLSVGGELDNTRGTIAATGALSATVAGNTNNTSGTLAANQQLQLAAAGLTNDKGSLQSAAGAVQLDVSGALNNGQGNIGAGTDLRIQAGSVSNLAGGSLRAVQDAQVTSSGQLLNAGSITAGRHTSVDAGSVQATTGSVLGAGIQADGTLAAAGDLYVIASQSLNAQGTNLAAGNANLQGASIDVSGSSTSAANLSLTATSGNVVTSSAQVVTPGTLRIAANSNTGQTLMNDAGTLNAGQLQISASNIANTNGGEIVQTGAAATTIAVTGRLNNDGGRIASNSQDLTLSGASITNTDGKIEHAGSGTLAISGGGFDGSKGQITGNGALTVDLSGGFAQDGGVTTAQQITIDAAALSNRGGEIIQTGTQATRITVVGAADNTDGSIASNGSMNVAAGSLVNHGGSIQATGASQLAVSTQSMLDNSNKGEIGAGGNTTISAGSLNNDAGRITAVGDISAEIFGVASNQGGTLTANGNTTITAASLNNSGGTVGAVTGMLAVTTSGATTNAGGSLLAGGAATFSNAGMNNSAGKVFGDRIAIDTHGQQLSNGLGTIAAAKAANLQTGALVNDAGLIQSGGALSIDTHGQALSNINAAGYAGGEGGITSMDTLTLSAGTVTNTAGYIDATGALSASTLGFFNAGGGIVLGRSAVAIDANNAGYDNSGGQTQALGDLTLAAGGINNTGGLIRSTETTTLSASDIVNANTQGVDQGIEGKNVVVNAGNLNNSAGAIRSDGNTTVASGGSVNNSGGLISAGNALIISDPNSPNPSAKTLRAVNTGGTLEAGARLLLDAASFSGDGTLASNQDATVSLTRDVTNNAEVSVSGNLSYGTTGKLTNNGKLLAGQTLAVSGNEVINAANAEMSGASTTINAATLHNRGLIDSAGKTFIQANVVNNIGTGRIYGDQLSIGATALNNDAETVAGVTSAATIAARQRLDIGVSELHNRNGALIYSDGALAIGGAMDAQGHATGTAALVENHASILEARTNLSIDAKDLTNSNGGVTYTLASAPGSGRQVLQFMLPGRAEPYDAAEVLFITSTGGQLGVPGVANQFWGEWSAEPAKSPVGAGTSSYTRLLVPSPAYPLERYGAYYLASPRHSADLVYRTYQGGDTQTLVTTTEPGYWYPITDPIWATFGIAPPTGELPADNPGRFDPNITVGQSQYTVTVEDPVTGSMRTETRFFAHAVTQTEYHLYHDYMGAHRLLDKATLAFIHTVLGGLLEVNSTQEYSPGRSSGIYDALQYTVEQFTPVLQSSAPGQILAGGNMALTVGQGRNNMSQILAGGTLTVGPGKIENVGLTVAAPERRTGTLTHSYVNGESREYQFLPYDLTIAALATLAAAQQEGHATFGNAISLPGAGSHSSEVGPQGAGDVTSLPNQSLSPIVQVALLGQAGVVGSGAAGASSAVGSPHTAAQRQASLVVRTSTPAASLPSASLFRIGPSTARYLVETDSRFANFRQWLGSDYLLNNLGLNPDTTLQRLGDGYYEQRLIREQVQKLTGYRFLQGFDDDEAQYTALMNSGITFALKHSLVPGVALTAGQMAQLTSDIVWLVEQTVTMADGSSRRVLVPQLYVRVQPGDIDGSGALLSGRNVDMQLTAEGASLVNLSGTIAGRETVKINAENIESLLGRVVGTDIALQAREDIRVVGGTVEAKRSLSLEATRDIVVTSTLAQGQSNAALGGEANLGLPGHSASMTRIDRIAGLYVSDADGSLRANAGRDMALIAAEVASGGDIVLSAKRDLVLGTLNTAETLDARWTTDNIRQSVVTQSQGSRISAVGDATLSAGNALTAQAVDIHAGQALAMSAGGNLVIEAAQTLNSARTSNVSSGSEDSSLRAESERTGLTRSQLSAQSIQLSSGADTTLSAVDATAQQLNIDAGGSLRLDAPVTSQRAEVQQSEGDIWNVSSSSSRARNDSVNYNRLNVGQLVADAEGGIQAQIGQNDSAQTLANQPGMGWINQLQQQASSNPVQWQRVQLASEHFYETQDGFGPAGALLITAIVGMATAGIGNAAGAAAGDAIAVGVGEGMVIEGATFLSTTGASVAGITSTAVQAGVANLASQAATSFISHEGDLDAVFRDLNSSDSVKQLVASMFSAGVAEAFPGGTGIQGVAASAIAGCAAAEATGENCRDGGIISGIWATLNTLNHYMRQDQISSSEDFSGVIDGEANLLTNTSGVSGGVDGNFIKLAGNRINVDLLCEANVCRNFGTEISPLWINPADGMVHLNQGVSLASVLANNIGVRPSPLGGLQGGSASLFGTPYAPGSLTDRLVESFAGPHDFFNAPHYYNALGNNFSGASEIWNVVNLFPAAPIGIATFGAQYPGFFQNMGIVYQGANARNETEEGRRKREKLQTAR